MPPEDNQPVPEQPVQPTQPAESAMPPVPPAPEPVVAPEAVPVTPTVQPAQPQVFSAAPDVAGVPAAAPVAPQPVQPAGDPGKTLGIVGLILAFLLPLIGLIVSIIAKSKSKKAGFKNGFALGGIIVSIVFMVLTVLFFGLTIAGLMAVTSAPAKASDTFMSDLLAKNFSAAYNETSSEFKQTYTQTDFEQSLGNISDAQLTIKSTTSKKINTSNGVTTATVVYDATAQGQPYTVTVELVKQNDKWLVISVDSAKK